MQNRTYEHCRGDTFKPGNLRTAVITDNALLEAHRRLAGAAAAETFGAGPDLLNLISSFIAK